MKPLTKGQARLATIAAPELSRQLGTRHARRRHRLSGAIADTPRGREINGLAVRVGLIGPNDERGQRGPWGSPRPVRVVDDGGSGLTLAELTPDLSGRRRRGPRRRARQPQRSA